MKMEMVNEMEKIKRESGVLLHITSLPDSFGLGTFSRECENFIDFLSAGSFGVWQVLPFTDCGYGMSPYSSCSAFAINPYYLDLSMYLSGEELNGLGLNKFNSNISQEREKRDRGLKIVYDKLKDDYDITSFEKKNAYWLNDYAIYKVAKAKYEGASWLDFPVGIRNRVKSDMDKFVRDNEEDIKATKFIQFLLDKRWREIRDYALSHGVRIFGDTPIYIELDSADVWSNSLNWQLKDGRPKVVAGVPPDYFNEDGQLWGYPIYDYAYMKKNNYDFWVKRFAKLSEVFDLVRIDHFVAMSRYYAIPYGSDNAKNGKWVRGYGDEILKLLMAKCKACIVAEDLGIVTEDVTKLREKYNIAGLKVMQFAFDGEGDNVYQPHNYEKNCVAYLGTHDNDTFMGLLNEGNWDKINRFKRYFGMPLERGNEEVVDNAILALYRSSADLIILTMQDILKLDSSARLNKPGVESDVNWRWQLGGIDMSLAGRYKYLGDLYAR